jgi:hypothetical protein
MMRKSCLLLAVLLLLTPLSAFSIAYAQPAAADTWALAAPLPAYETLFEVAPDDTGAWLAADERVYRYDDQTGALTERGAYPGLAHIVSLSGTLIAQIGDRLCWIDEAGAERLAVPIEGYGYICQIKPYAGDILILSHAGGEQWEDAAILTLLDGQAGTEKARIDVPYEAHTLASDDLGRAYICA